MALIDEQFGDGPFGAGKEQIGQPVDRDVADQTPVRPLRYENGVAVVGQAHRQMGGDPEGRGLGVLAVESFEQAQTPDKGRNRFRVRLPCAPHVGIHAASPIPFSCSRRRARCARPTRGGPVDALVRHGP